MKDFTPDETKYPDDWFRSEARRIHGEEGEVEIDDGATISRSSDGGAYVQAWVWVPTPIEEEEQ